MSYIPKLAETLTRKYFVIKNFILPYEENLEVIKNKYIQKEKLTRIITNKEITKKKVTNSPRF